MIINKEQLTPYIKADSDLIPLHVWNKETVRKGKTQQRGKTPLNGDWTKHPKDIQTALSLAKKGHNVGYRLNENDLIIDVDQRNFGEEDSLEKLCEFLGIEDLSDKCPTVITGSGGYHYYMTKPVDLNFRELTDEFPGIEFKTKGRQVVAAGSRHPNGNYYEWDDFSPEFTERPKAPKKLIKLLEREIPTQQSESGSINGEQLATLLEQLPVEDYADHEKWFSIMCASHHGTGGTGMHEFLDWSLSDDKYSEDEHLIRHRWDSLGGKKVNYTVATLYKAVLAHGGSTSVVTAQEDFKEVESEEDSVDFDDVMSSPELDESYEKGLALRLANNLHPQADDEEIVKAIRAALQAGIIEQGRALEIVQKKAGMTKGTLNEVIKQIKEQIVEDLGRILAEKTLDAKFYKGKGLVFNNNGQFWAYNGQFWTTITKQYVGRHITDVLDKMRKKIDVKVKENAIVNEALGIMERITAVRNDALRLRERPYPVINCRNGELWIEKDGSTKLRVHRPQSYLLQVLDVEYSPGAECPLFDQAIRQTFGNFEDCEDIVRHFEEFMGYVLHPDKRPAHWWLLKGPGGDGKTTLMKILSGLLGDAVVPESIDRFSGGSRGDSHATAELVGKLLIYDDDLNRNTVLPDGTLKKLSEDGEITANPKGVQGYKFTKVCTVAMLSNGYPKTKDITRGFRRRAMVVPFNRGFHEGGAITDLAEQVIEQELAGVMNRALQGFQRLRKRGQFKEPSSCTIAREQWLHESNTVALFIKECVERTEDVHDKVDLQEMFSAYSSWCHGYNVKRVDTKQAFRTSMEDMDLVYGKASGNKSVFKFVKLKYNEAAQDFKNDAESEEDEDW